MSREPQVEEERAKEAGRLARLGGEIAVGRIGRKPDGSMLTDVDLEVQERLCREIRVRFPGDGIIAEEAGVFPGWEGDPPHWWVIDPVDGTANYGQGIPGFAISVAVLRDGPPCAGAVYDPADDQLYRASRGRGAWCNGHQLSLAPRPLTPQSFVAIRSPYGEGIPSFILAWLRRYRLRRFGSTALQLCYVASGALPLVHDQRAYLWDIAAAACVLFEAGGCLTRPDGAPLFSVCPAAYRGEPLAFLAGDPASHPEGLRDVREGGAAACRVWAHES